MVSVEPDIVELARVGLLGSNCTIWAVGLFDQSVVLQSQVITHIWPATRSTKTARCNESSASDNRP